MTPTRVVLARVPPPVLFAAPLVFGLWLDGRFPRPWVPDALARAGSVAGWALVAAGAALAVDCMVMFLRRRTTIVPHRRACSLVTSGPFRITRNPMYVALICLYLGVSVIGNALWPVLLLAIPIAFLQAITIPIEERMLAKAFGAEYGAYASRVHRWL